MAWPTPQDYNEAIQNPTFCFSDRELQAGTPELTPLGLPRPITGNFTSVYRLSCGGSDWAVRCFWREFADLQTRYMAISAHLAAARMPYTVGFQYLERGIRVRGQWYPVLKMEWVEGELLDEYIERNLSNEKTLDDLAGKWLEMCAALGRAGVAHGDLQHGNVIVAGERLVLVDYDGMYVPALAGRISHETGHPNYQHPGRTGADFGPYLDHFSAWSVYLSLRATAHDPRLWSDLAGGDECLLLRRADYDAPDLSPAFTALMQHPDAPVRDAVLRVRDFLRLSPSRVPAPVPDDAPASGYPGIGVAGRAPEWFMRASRALVPSVPAEVALLDPPRRRSGPDWLADHVSTVDEIRDLDAPHPLLRVTVPLLALVLVASVVVLAAFAVPVLTLIGIDVLASVVAAVTLILGYRSTEPMREMRDMLARVSTLQREIRYVRRAVDRGEKERAALRDAHALNLTQIEEMRQSVRERVAARREDLEAARVTRFSELDVSQKSNSEREASDLEHALESLQARHIHDALRHATVRTASIPGIGWPGKLRLFALGIWAAADLTAEKIRTIGGMDEDELLALVTWRVECERAARRTAPRKLGADTTLAIGVRYARRRDSLDAERRAVEAEWRADDMAIASECADSLAQLERDEADIRQEFEDDMRELEAELTELRAEVPELETQLQGVYAELYPYRRATFRRYLELVLGRGQGPTNSPGNGPRV